MKSFAVFALSTAVLAAPAMAQTNPTAAPAAQTGTQAQVGAQAQAGAEAGAPRAGATVLDTEGGTVGTIDSVTPQGAVVSTGSVTVTLPLASFAAGPNGPVIALTRAQLEEQARAAQAEVAAATEARFVAGTNVESLNGTSIGTIREVSADSVTVTTASGDARLPRTAFAGTETGLRIGMTAAQLQAAISAATPAAGN